MDSVGGSDISLTSPSAGGNSNGANGGNGPSFPPRNYGSPNQQNRGSAFTVQVKPKDPPIFHGRVSEDVVTWTSKVQDFFYLTEAGDAQQVAYATTLLQDAAANWWHVLLRTRCGYRPRNFVEFVDLLEYKFGSSNRVDRARTELRTIRQGQSDTVRSYSTRFEALLGKLPSWDEDWAKS